MKTEEDIVVDDNETKQDNNSNDDYIGGTAYQEYHKQQNIINEKNREKYEIIPSKKLSPQALKLQEQRKVPFIEFNDRDLKAFMDIGVDPPERLRLYEDIKRFLHEIDITKGPIQRAVTAMVRLKAPDYLSNPEDKHPPRREFIYYLEKWEGVDYLGVPVNPVRDHFQGVYTKQFTTPVYSKDRGQIIDLKLDPDKAHKIYYIPFSKKAVDDIIAKYPGTDKNSIVFTIKFDVADSYAGNSQRSSRAQFRYEQFVSKWEEVYRIQTMPPTEIWDKYIRTKGKTADSLAFEPT